MDRVVFNETLINFRPKICSVKHPERYDAIEAISQGGQGFVFKAHDRKEDKEVAIKKIKHDFKNDLNQVFAKNVYRELELGTLVDHQNIMRICDAYTPQATYNSFQDIYLVFDYMEGGDLQRFCRNQNYLNNVFKDYQHGAPIIADLMLQLFSAIAYLHQDNLKLIHRDIKPENLFLRKIYENEYLLKLGDLGIARQIPPPPEQMTENVCTLFYRAPEIVKERNYSIPVDIWSAGCVLAEILVIKPNKDASATPFFYSRDLKELEKLQCEINEEKINTIFANSKLTLWQNLEPWGNYFRSILSKTLKLNPNERATAVQILEFADPNRLIHKEKFRFEMVQEPYKEEKVENSRRMTDWKMMVYDKLEQIAKQQ